MAAIVASSAPANAPESDVHITKLPMEILAPLPYLLYRVDNLYALLGTSRMFYLACAGTSAKLAPSRRMDKRLTLADTVDQER